MAVASVETMICDTLKYYLSVIPQKIEKEQLSVTKDDLLAHQFDLVEVQVGKLLHSLGYKPIGEMLDYFCHTLSLAAKADALAAPLLEVKATRNILLHNSLVVNGAYLELAGPSRRAMRAGQTLKIDQSYLAASVGVLRAFVAEIRQLISEKYADYTKLAAIRRLWAFTFDSPVMPFDDFWIVNEEEDRISFRKRGEYEDGISGSETALLGVWRAHFSGYARDLEKLTMYIFDQTTQAKLLYLLSVFRHFRIQ
jgi:hypothetical protein